MHRIGYSEKNYQTLKIEFFFGTAHLNNNKKNLYLNGEDFEPLAFLCH